MKKSFSKTKRISQVRIKAKSSRGIKRLSEPAGSRKTRRAEKLITTFVNPRTRRIKIATVKPRGLMKTRAIRMKGMTLKRATGRKSSRKAGTRKRK
ncbi:MAG: hypothetical protein HXS40_07425 [Theionarchaea archaeon]|nr:hypothetical protein [Theionarchaea archaeon]